MDNVTAIVPAAQPRAMVRALEFTAEQRKMIRDSFAGGASDSEFAVLMEIAKTRNLNPLLRQIHFVKRWDGQKRCEVWSTQISIDGLRAVAERTGVYAGQDEPEYEERDGKLVCCKVRVYRKDWPRPAVGVAYFEEYAQTKRDGGLTQFWATKPHIMLAKCAEALAIRKAFPEDTSGLYVAEEMGETHAEPVAPATPRPAPAVEVLPPEPKPDPKPEAKKPAVPPPHVSALWTRVRKNYGPDAKTKFEGAAALHFKANPKPSHEWTPEDSVAIAELIFGDADIKF
jgi:phage recombination protein Bet